MAVLNVDIVASLDDGHVDGTSFFNTGTQMWMGGTPSAEHMWMLFKNITIDKDATIDSAFVNLELDTNGATSDITSTWAAEDADDPIPFDGYDSGSMQWVNRVSTSATVNWTLVGAWSLGNKQTTDLKTIIQEIVDRPGWVNGNDILLWCSSIAPNNGEEWGFDAWDQVNVDPELVITYTEGQSETTSGILNTGGGLSATVTKNENQTLRPASTVTAGDWDTAPTGGQSLDGYTSDESDATWIEDTTVV